MDDDVFGEDPQAPKPAPVKKSLFSKKVLAKVVNPDADGVELFSRSREVFPQRLAEEERKRQKKIIKLERKRSSASAEIKETSPPVDKKRRVSTNNTYSSDEELVDTSRARRDSSHSTPGSRKSRSHSVQKSQASPTSLSERYHSALRAQKQDQLEPKKVEKGCISLSEGDNDDESSPPADIVILDDGEGDYVPYRRKPPPLKDDDDGLSDEEFPELLEQARQREKQKALLKENASKVSEKNHNPVAGTFINDDIFQLSGPVASDDPTIEILISSMIDGSKPLVVKRKLSQRLKEVRLSWCDKQALQGLPMTPEVKDTVFLTWRGHKLYDFTTCSALGLKIDTLGKLTADGAGVDDNGRVHLEAWTQELFTLAQKRQEAKEASGQEYDEEEEEAEEKRGEIKIKLIMKSREFGECKLVAKPTTHVRKMIAYFRLQKEIPDDKEISVHVDGEKLDPESRVEDTELEDMDVVEVHIR